MTDETPEYPTYPPAGYGGYPPPGAPGVPPSASPPGPPSAPPPGPPSASPPDPPSAPASASPPAAPPEPAPAFPGPQAQPEDQPHPEPGRPAGASVRRTVLTAAVVAAVVGGGIGAGTVALVDNNDSNTPAGLTFSDQAAPAAKVDGTVSAAAAKISPSVVTVNVTAPDEQDTGSGVIIRSDGYILTNNHVISAATGHGQLTVTLADGRQVKATVVGTDASDDLAVIKVGLHNLAAATFTSSRSLVVGQTVVAVGAPLGLSDTVTSGIVSNTARPVQTGDSTAHAVFDAVQTDAAINPGNSGGPLVDLAGHVVGINAAIATDQSSGGLQIPGQSGQSGNIGIGFAIPSDEASRIAGELIKSGHATHAVLGVSVTDGASAKSAHASTGALVKTVTAHSPAAAAGLAKGDVVTKLAGQRIDDANALVAAVRSHAPGNSVSISYLRGGQSRTANVRLGSGSS
jgi:putative serine protease PepD